MVLIRQKQGVWHDPDTSAYRSEKELQDLVKRAPTLLPGGEELAVVDEFWIPGIGSVDLVGVSATGDLTIVECKLKANPEIRREVIRQILAYAGGLWRMGYDEFASTFAARAGMSLTAALGAVGGVEVNEAELRDSLATRLRNGEFRLVVAVDAITPELRLIIEYLNEHTLAPVQVLALELAYARDGDVELLIPAVYGVEAADRKARAASTKYSKWNSETFGAKAEAQTDGSVRAFIHSLLQHGAQKGHHPFYGSGATPGMSYYYEVDGHPVSGWALYLYEPVPKVAVSLGAIAKSSPGKAKSLLQRLKAHPTLASALAEINETTLDKYPQMPVDPVLLATSAQEAFLGALDDLLTDASDPSADAM
jgi:hypothetical protein